MKKPKDYIRSLPIRLIAAAIVFAVLLLLGKFDKKEEPAAPQPGHRSGLLDAHHDSTETALRVMASRPPDK